MKLLDLNDVRTFAAAAEAGTLSGAAKELAVPPPPSAARSLASKGISAYCLCSEVRAGCRSPMWARSTYKHADAHSGDSDALEEAKTSRWPAIPGGIPIMIARCAASPFVSLRPLSPVSFWVNRRELIGE